MFGVKWCPGFQRSHLCPPPPPSSTPQKLEDTDKKSQYQLDSLEREQRHLKRQLELLGGAGGAASQGSSAEGERIRTDSVGSALSPDRSDSDQGELDQRVQKVDLWWLIKGVTGCASVKAGLILPLPLSPSSSLSLSLCPSVPLSLL